MFSRIRLMHVVEYQKLCFCAMNAFRSTPGCNECVRDKVWHCYYYCTIGTLCCFVYVCTCLVLSFLYLLLVLRKQMLLKMLTFRSNCETTLCRPTLDSPHLWYGATFFWNTYLVHMYHTSTHTYMTIQRRMFMFHNWLHINIHVNTCW